MKSSRYTVTKKERAAIFHLFLRIGKQLNGKSASRLDPSQVIRELTETSEPLVVPSKLSFRLYRQFYVRIPNNYDHGRQLAQLWKMHAGHKVYIDAEVNDGNMRKVTSKLVPGKKYLVKIVHIVDRVSSDDCLDFLKSQKDVLLVGAQGLAFIFRNKKDELPKDSRIVSYDQESFLPKDETGGALVPRLVHEFIGIKDSNKKADDWRFILQKFGYMLDPREHVYLLQFCQLNFLLCESIPPFGLINGGIFFFSVLVLL